MFLYRDALINSFKNTAKAMFLNCLQTTIIINKHIDYLHCNWPDMSSVLKTVFSLEQSCLSLDLEGKQIRTFLRNVLGMQYS